MLNKMVFIGIAITCLAAGCESLNNSSKNLTSFLGDDDREKDVEKHRENYQRTRSPAELDWLLANQVDAGMTPLEVSAALGEKGSVELNDDWITNGGGQYQTGDETWKWGPDSDGRVMYLVFRDRKLVNFDPKEFSRDRLAPAFDDAANDDW